MFTLLETNWYSVFYWMTVADSVKDFFDTSSNIFTFFTIIMFILLVICVIGRGVNISANRLKSAEEEAKDADVRSWELPKKWAARLFYTMLVCSIITWMGYVFTPTKKDALLIVAGGAGVGFLTSDSSARALPADLTKYLHTALVEQTKDLSTEVREKLGVATPKESLLNKAAKMTKDELIEYLKNDTTLVK